ncbi:MAG: S1 RNA-binding domain-containing protein, partial [Deltaproteobacteria bacterium]|nr:S1 RNA-binding domain-containing protein [Deltaproteobacteria bacterium]
MKLIINKDPQLISELSRRYSKGAIVEAQVQLLKRFGAIVALTDGSPGIIRNRELSWTEEPQHPGEMLVVGQVIKAAVLGVDRTRPRLKLSLRQAEHDPWQELDRRYQLGQVVRRQIARLWRTGAFVELEPAIDGFIPLHEIAPNPPVSIDQVLWIGDTIEAVIIKLDLIERRVEMSIRRHLLALEREQPHQLQAAVSQGSFGLALSQALQQAQAGRAGADEEGGALYQARLVQSFPRLLLVDDDAGFRFALQRLLTQLGHQVEAVDQGEKALALCAKEQFDLVLMDHSFRSSKLDGLEITRRLLRNQPRLPILLLTGLIWLERTRDIVAEARAAGARDALIKPVELSTLTRAMAALLDGAGSSEPALPCPLPSRAVSLPPAQLYATPAYEDLAQALYRELLELRQATDSQAVALFHMASHTRQVNLVAHAGAPLPGYEQSRYMLQLTPIDEVIRLGQVISEPDISRNPQRFQYLNLLPFAACLGLPVSGFGPREYGLFLFDPRRAHFTREHEQECRLAAKLIGAIIARKEAERIIRQAQPFVFAGQLGSSLAHELNNLLSRIEIDTTTLLSAHRSLRDKLLSRPEPPPKGEVADQLSLVK